jgi:hypothetical protein
MSRVVSSPQTKTPVAPPAKMPMSTTSSISQEKIAQRAYEKWMKRGCIHGCDMQDWTEAEAELRAESGQSKPGMPMSRR